MSYNGIGLQTARGSGTSGHVQKNLSTSKKSSKGHYESRKQKKELDKAKESKIVSDLNRENAKQDILQHNRKREIDVKCAELRDELEDGSEDEETIAAKVDELRKRLQSEHQPAPKKEAAIDKSPGDDVKTNQSDPTRYAPRFPKSSDNKNRVR